MHSVLALNRVPASKEQVLILKFVSNETQNWPGIIADDLNSTQQPGCGFVSPSVQVFWQAFKLPIWAVLFWATRASNLENESRMTSHKHDLVVKNSCKMATSKGESWASLDTNFRITSLWLTFFICNVVRAVGLLPVWPGFDSIPARRQMWVLFRGLFSTFPPSTEVHRGSRFFKNRLRRLLIDFSTEY